MFCIKQVPNTYKVKIDNKTGNIIREGNLSIINPYDKNALEEALILKEIIGATVTAVTMGPAQAEAVLREALAMGVDEVILICDKIFSGSDTLVTANALSSALKKLNCDLILTGAQTIDGGTAQVGPKIAEKLEIPQVTFIEKLSVDEKYLKVNRILENEYETISVKMPVVVTVLGELNKARYPQIRNILEAYKKKIEVLTAKDLEMEEAFLGVEGSFTRVKRIWMNEMKPKGKLIKNTCKETAAYAVEILKEKHYI